MANEKYLTWKEMEALALKNYAKGGDMVYECWDARTYEEMGPFTKKQALAMFARDYDIEKDEAGW